MSFLNGIARNLARLAWHRYPFYSGQYKVMQTRIFRNTIPHAGVGEIVIARHYGLHLAVRLDDVEGQSIYYLGDWDPRLTWLFQRLLRPGMTCIDVGANFGSLSLIAAKAVGRSGFVHSFEPQFDLADMIVKSAGLNDLPQLHVHRVALSKCDGEFDLFIPEGHSGGASLSRQSGEASRVVKIPVHRATDYFERIGISEIDLIKIDVEGHEGEVLEGARNLFNCRPPGLVLFECMEQYNWTLHNPGISMPPFRDTASIRFLRDFDYEFYGVGRSYLRVKFHRLDPRSELHPPLADILAIHPRVLAANKTLLNLG